MAETGVVAGRALTDFVSLGVLASRVPRDAVDDAVEATGKGARRRGGKLPPHVVVYLVMALALFSSEDYEEVVELLTGTLRAWGCWHERWEPPTKGAVTQARQRLGPEPMAELFSQVAVPPADLDTEGAFLGRWRLMSIDGTELDAPDTPANRDAFGPAADQGPFPRVRLVTVAECASHAPALAAMGPSASKGSGEQSLARKLYPRLEEGWLLLADRNFYNWKDWCRAAGSGADLLWRVKEDLRLPPLELLPDGSFRSVLISPKTTGKRRDALIEAARRGEDLDQDEARHVRVIEYEVPDRDGDGKDELIALVTTITGLARRPGRGPGGRIPPKMGERDRERPAQDHSARPREGAPLRQPGTHRAGDLGIPADQLRHLRPDLRGRYRRRDRPRPGEVQADRPRRPPGCRPGLSPLTRLTRSCPRSRPTSPGRRTSVPAAGTAPTLAPSSADATTPTASRNPPTTASATIRRQPSGSPIR